MAKKEKLPKKLVYRYGELSLVQENLYKKSLLGTLTVEDEVIYRTTVLELADLRKSLLKYFK